MKDIEPKIRKLEMIQNIISRMEQNSIMLKGWAIALISGVFVLSSKDSNPTYFLIAYIPTILFWLIDSMYLQLQRRYRVLYNRNAIADINSVDFDMTIPAPTFNEKTEYIQCLFSRTEWIFYVPIAILITIVVVIAK